MRRRLVVLATAAFVLAATQQAALAAWTVAAAGGSSGAAHSGTASETVNGTCVATTPATACGTSNLLPSTAGTSTATVVNSGAFANSYGVTATTCGAAQVSDSASTLTVAHGAFSSTSYQAAGPLSGNALTFDGSTNWLGTGGTAATGPTNFTELAWFKTSTSNAGPLLTFESSYSPLGGSSQDRTMWIYNGTLVAGVAPSGTARVATGATAVSNGAWHLAAMTVSSTNGLKVYLDGALLGSNTNGKGGQSYSGYWTIGAAVLSGWTGYKPSNVNGSGVGFFTGAMAGVAVIPSELTAANISALYGQTSLASYASAVAGYSPTHYWGLQDAAPTAASTWGSALPGQTDLYPDLSGTGNDATASGTVGTDTSGPLGASAATTFDGATSYLSTADAITPPTTYTEAVWFKTTATTTQPLIWFGTNTNPSANGGSADRYLWVTGSGAVTAHVYNTASQNATSAAGYNNGAWHLAVATLSSAGLKLYLDGALAATNSATTAYSSYSGNTYWGIGAGNTSTSTPQFFNGSLAGVGIFESTALTATQISGLYNSSSFANYSGTLVSLNPDEYWSLTDRSDACSAMLGTVAVTIGATTTCLLPVLASGTACPAVASGMVLSNITGAIVNTAVTSPVNGSATITLKLADNGTLPVSLTASGTGNTGSGVDVLIDVTITGGKGSWLAGAVYSSSQTRL